MLAGVTAAGLAGTLAAAPPPDGDGDCDPDFPWQATAIAAVEHNTNASLRVARFMGGLGRGSDCERGRETIRHSMWSNHPHVELRGSWRGRCGFRLGKPATRTVWEERILARVTANALIKKPKTAVHTKI